MSLALYVHMPWCVRKCPYCDFNSHQLKSAQPDSSYVDALLRDFDLEAPRLEGRRIDTVFFGGGTPSLFLPEEFARLLYALRQRIAFAEHAEITLEANPGTIERGRFDGYADAGVNRVSLGAQSFDAGALQALGRIHSVEDTLRAVDELRGAKLANFNIDLMYALPGQTLESACADVRAACALAPAHVSYYQLTLEPGTVFHTRPPVLPDEDLAWQIQIAGQQLLADSGYEQYEVSAYAKDGLKCRHNLNYWLFGDYVGLGAGAHGKLSLAKPGQILRTTKPKQPRDYQEQIRRAGPAAARGAQTAARTQARAAMVLQTAADHSAERALIGASAYIAAADLPFEFMLNALRLNDGFSSDCYEGATGLPLAPLQSKLEASSERGLLRRRPGGWQPTELGRRFLNDLQAGFLA